MSIKSRIVDWLGVTIDTADYAVALSDDDLSTLAANVYFESAAVETAISYISGAIAKCEVKTFKAGTEDKGELYYLLNIAPNPNQNASQFWSAAIYKLMLDGACLIVPVAGGLYVADSWGANDRAISEWTFEGVTVGGLTLKQSFRADRVLYLTYGNKRARTLIDGMFAKYAKMMDLAQAGFQERAGSKWKYDVSTMPIGTPEFRKESEREYQDPSGKLKTFAKNANAIFVANRGEDLTKYPTGEGVNSSDLVAIRKDAFETIASVFKVPPPMLWGNMTNVADITREFLTYAVDPLAEMITQEGTRKFFTQLQFMQGDKIKMDTSTVDHVDIFRQAASISQLIGAGFSLDELRGVLGWPLINTDESQEHLITRNYGALEDVLRGLATSSGGGDTQ